MKEYILVIRSKEDGSVGKTKLIDYILNSDSEFEFENGETLTYSDFLFFQNDYEISIEEVEK